MSKLKHAQKKVDQLDIDAIDDEFIRGSEHRLRQFACILTFVINCQIFWRMSVHAQYKI